MKIGVRIPVYRKWCRAAEIRRIATMAENLGFDSLWVQDHLVAPMGPAEEIAVGGTSNFLKAGEGAPAAKPMSLFEYYAGDDWWLDPYVVWSYLAGITSRVTLASDILVLPYRNPVVQAKMIGTIDQLSGGRLMIGTGTGHVEAESKALGLDFAARGRMHDEYLRCIRAILAGEEASFDGEFVSFGPLRTLIRPVQQPAPPFYTGGNGPRAIRRAIELGDGWLPNAADPEGLAKGMALLESTAAEMGRTELPKVAVSLPNRIRLATPSARAGGRPLMDADAAIADLKAFEALGVDHVSIGLLMPNVDIYLEQIEFFANKVLPAFR
ncbi:TIGR03619 family F420-dependent LLM class oxidoreductase [Sandaracinobacter sp. RS1-74]|uniref:TIGR03619 family F420-dependent LLM class oxidoreductase n=1 Tax=Sandaracinobacteroides sayramensis TaxID=2913411 RepID=UPI001EDB2C53|nr:TIGR03619 family F420-dependent LLM class oxidoreductase [Sandaracinobacteroides sayramensis]MCG2841143.1 TIGR03619 family F420-dependent LLM class oxidoreductase [Sandaracinobacteroides sayramensis]